MGGTQEPASERIARERTNSSVSAVPQRRGCRYTLLRAPDGSYLRCCCAAAACGKGLRDGGHRGLMSALTAGDDECMFEATANGGYKHVLTQQLVDAKQVSAAGAVPERGPDRLPSAYLLTLAETGLVVLPSLLEPALCGELQQLALETAKDPAIARLSPVHQLDH